MGYVKEVKNSSYFSRFQVKFKRRRQGKTDYRARLRLCTQDRNKYNTHKYRLVVRFSNKDITCQVVYAAIAGDVVVAAAYARELPRYGLSVGLTNYAAAYCVGLLVARRVLTKFGLAEAYTGVEEATGEDYNVEENDEGPRPFFCLLDAGLKRTSTGSKIFAALKGALDGGLDIPHSEKRFVGFDKGEKSLDSDVLRKYIFGGHVADYMSRLNDEEPDRYKQQFSRYLRNEIESDDLEDLYKKVHQAIREKPAHEATEKKRPKDEKKWQKPKLTYDERKEKLRAKLSTIMEEKDD